MAFTLEQGSQSLNAFEVDSMVKQIAAQTYKFKQAVLISPTSSLDNIFFRENPAVLTTTTGINSIKGVPFGAAIPSAHPKWERLSSRVLAFKLEDNIAWEVMKGSIIDIQARTIIKLTAAVVKTVDDYIFDIISQSQAEATALAIQSFAILNSLNGRWDESSAAIVDNLMSARRLLANKFYDDSNTLTFVSPRDNQSIMTYLHNKGAQYNTLAQDIAVNGKTVNVAGTTLVVSPSVVASFALMVVPKVCATYKEFVSLRTVTIEDPLKSWTIRVAEEGVVELTDPLAIVLIKNTQSGSA